MESWKKLFLFLILVFSVLLVGVAGSGASARADLGRPDNAKPGLVGGAEAAAPPFATSPPPAQPAASTAPVIEVWYGQTQSFGNRLGRRADPQKWANILGRVTPAAGVNLTYSLNGGPAIPLVLGPDDQRLAQAGDFNIELDYTDLLPGANQVLITAGGAAGNAQLPVTVNYASGPAWTPGSYSFNWGAAAAVTDLAQVVDGQWRLDGGGVRPNVFEYDRLVALGDMSWRDYTVTVPITIFSVDPSGYFGPSNGPGVGFLTRWNGHYDNGTVPLTGWSRIGALGWYRWQKSGDVYTEGLQLAGNNNYNMGSSDKQLQIGVTYNFKMNIVSNPDPAVAADYKFKVWPAAEAEPAAWDIEERGQKDEPRGGSVVLVAHHVDARFGPVTVELASTRPQPTLTVNTAGEGSGDVSRTPPGPTYRFGEDVLLVAAPGSGSVFTGWSGDLSGAANPDTIEMFENHSVTAIFGKYTQSTFTVNVSANGSGTVKKSPDKATYANGEQVTITAEPSPNNSFVNWSGSLSGGTNPITITVNKNMTIVGNFTAAPLRTLSVTVVGNGTVTRSPDKAAYVNGESVTLTATPIGDAEFVGWSGAAGGATNPLTIVMDADKSITAIFFEEAFAATTYLPTVLGE